MVSVSSLTLKVSSGLGDFGLHLISTVILDTTWPPAGSRIINHLDE